MRYKVTSPPSAAATRVVSVQRPCNKHFQKKENNKLLPVPRQREPPLRCRGCWRGRSPGPSAARPPRPAHQQSLVLRTDCMFECLYLQTSLVLRPGGGPGPGGGAGVAGGRVPPHRAALRAQQEGHRHPVQLHVPQLHTAQYRKVFDGNMSVLSINNCKYFFA